MIEIYDTHIVHNNFFRKVMAFFKISSECTNSSVN